MHEKVALIYFLVIHMGILTWFYIKNGYKICFKLY